MALLDAVAKSLQVVGARIGGKTMRVQVLRETPDFATGRTTQTEVFGSPFTVQGVIENVDTSGANDAQFDGVEIRPGDLKITIPSDQVVNGTKRHEITAGDVLWLPAENTNQPDEKRTVKAVQRRYGGDNIYAYVCLVRR